MDAALLCTQHLTVPGRCRSGGSIAQKVVDVGEACPGLAVGSPSATAASEPGAGGVCCWAAAAAAVVEEEEQEQ